MAIAGPVDTEILQQEVVLIQSTLQDLQSAAKDRIVAHNELEARVYGARCFTRIVVSRRMPENAGSHRCCHNLCDKIVYLSGGFSPSRCHLASVFL
jgi:hypothetical protein